MGANDSPLPPLDTFDVRPGIKHGSSSRIYRNLEWAHEFEANRRRREVEWPVKLECDGITYEMHKPDPALKKRSWWIVAAPNAGKTRWINRTFAGTRIYCPRAGPYPFEGYAGQAIVIYDDRKKVSFEEFSDVLNTWDIVHPVFGEVRFRTQDWPVGKTRNVIVLSNKTIEESFEAEDHLRMKKRFIQIVNPKLIPPEEMSDNEEEPPTEAVTSVDAVAEGWTQA